MRARIQHIVWDHSTYLNRKRTHPPSPLHNNPIPPPNRPPPIPRKEQRMTRRAPRTRQRARLLQAQVPRHPHQPLVAHNPILRQHPILITPAPRSSPNVSVTPVAALEPGIGMQDYSVADAPFGARTDGFDDSGAVEARDQTGGCGEGVERGRSQDEEVPRVEGDGVDPDEGRVGSWNGFVVGGGSVEFEICKRGGGIACCVGDVLVDLPGLRHFLFIFVAQIHTIYLCIWVVFLKIQ